MRPACHTSLSRRAGDYWPGEAENLLLGIAEEQRQAGKRAGKGPGPTAKVSLAPRSKGSAKVPCCPFPPFFCLTPAIEQTFPSEVLLADTFMGEIWCCVFSCSGRSHKRQWGTVLARPVHLLGIVLPQHD